MTLSAWVSTYPPIHVVSTNTPARRAPVAQRSVAANALKNARALDTPRPDSAIIGTSSGPPWREAAHRRTAMSGPVASPLTTRTRTARKALPLASAAPSVARRSTMRSIGGVNHGRPADAFASVPTMLPDALPPAVGAALAAPAPGARVTVRAAGIPWSGLTWGDQADRPLLLLHGVTSSAATWWRIGPALAAAGRRVLALDLPGHGMTGHWQGHHRHRDNAADVAAAVRAAGWDRPELQVVGHSWGAVTAAALPVAGLRPATLVLIDPPVLPLEIIALEASDPAQRTFDDLGEAMAAVRAANPVWEPGDVAAKAEALTQLDEAAARSVVLDNGDWDGGLADLRDPVAAGVSVWIVRGDPAAGGYLADEPVAAFEAVIGAGRVVSLRGAPHSPHRSHPRETTAAVLHALES